MGNAAQKRQRLFRDTCVARILADRFDTPIKPANLTESDVVLRVCMWSAKYARTLPPRFSRTLVPTAPRFLSANPTLRTLPPRSESNMVLLVFSGGGG